MSRVAAENVVELDRIGDADVDGRPAERALGPARHPAPSLDDVDLVVRDAGDVGQEALKLLAHILARADGRRRGDEADLLRLDGKGEQDAPQEQRDLGRRRADQRMGLVEDDPFQLALRGVDDAADPRRGPACIRAW